MNLGVEELERKKQNADREASVLEKLLKIDKEAAIVMAMDMLLAGIDTVRTALQAPDFFNLSDHSLTNISLDFVDDSRLPLSFSQKPGETGKIAPRN